MPRPAQAAPFVGACRLDALEGGACSSGCATRLAPFNRDCFHSVLSEDFFQYLPGHDAPATTAINTFYDACFPPPDAAGAADAPQQQKAPTLSAAGAGAVTASSAAAPVQAGRGAWGLLVAAGAAAMLLAA